jgi:hypothetical protein
VKSGIIDFFSQCEVTLVAHRVSCCDAAISVAIAALLTLVKPAAINLDS